MDAPNYCGAAGKDCLKIGITRKTLMAKAQMGLSFQLGQFYGVVVPGLINAQHVFAGLKRDMLVGDDDHADEQKLAVTWAATRDAQLVGASTNAKISYLPAPVGKVFVTYITLNQRPDEFPEIHGWAEHWAWLSADSLLPGAPVEWDKRYTGKVWSA